MSELSQHEAKSLLLELLQKIDEQGPAQDIDGICDALYELGATLDILIIFTDLYTDWPEYSGVRAYPVAHSSLDPAQAFNCTLDFWDPRTEYGRARWRLLHWCIDTLKGELNA